MLKDLVLLSLTCFYTMASYGQAFQQLCSANSTDGVLVDFEYFNDSLYTTGFFEEICGNNADHIATWTNNEWIESNLGLSDPGHSLRTIDGLLYIARYEESVDSNWVYVYDGTALETLGQGVYLSTASGFSELPHIYDIIEYDGDIIACGEFDRVGSEVINGIMRWDGTQWNPLSSGLSGHIPNSPPVIYPHQMMVHEDELYVVGNFAMAGDEIVNGVAKWNGSEWSSMDEGFNGTVYSIAVYEGAIIAGGSFTESNGNTVERIARWNGSTWIPMEFGFSQPAVDDFIFVHTLAIIEDALYITGGLKEIRHDDESTEPCNGIVKYTGSELFTFDSSVPDLDIEAVIGIEDTDDILIGGGVFGSGYSAITGTDTHLHSPDEGTNILVYPNPSYGEIKIEVNNHWTSYRIYDLQGRLVEEGSMKTTLRSTLDEGLYLLQINTNEGNVYSEKIVIKE